MTASSTAAVISFEMKGRPIAALHAFLNRRGLVFATDYWLGPNFHQQLCSGRAKLVFVDQQVGVEAKLVWA